MINVVNPVRPLTARLRVEHQGTTQRKPQEKLAGENHPGWPQPRREIEHQESLLFIR